MSSVTGTGRPCLLIEGYSLVNLQMAIEIEANQGLSDEPGSLMDHVSVGLISASRPPTFLVD